MVDFPSVNKFEQNATARHGQRLWTDTIPHSLDLTQQGREIAIAGGYEQIPNADFEGMGKGIPPAGPLDDQGQPRADPMGNEYPALPISFSDAIASHWSNQLNDFFSKMLVPVKPVDIQ